MGSRIVINTVGVLGLAVSYWMGSLPGKEGEGAQDAERNSGGEILVRGEGDSERREGEKLRRGNQPGIGTVDLELLSGTHEPNRRLEILLEVLKHSPTEEYSKIYLAMKSGSEHERRLVLHTMFQRNALASLQFVKDHDPGNLEFALDIGLKVDSELVASWAQAAKVQTMDLTDYEDSQIPNEKIDEWIAASREAREGQEVPEWTKELPSGKPVVETVREVVSLSATHSNRGRYWLVNSKDTRARMRAAGDIGWESDDMSWDDFDDWLLDLPVELAEAALAGRLERLAAENPGNSELLLDALDRYSEVYQLDQSVYLMALRLINGENGEQALIGQLVARIDAIELREEAEVVAVRYYGESFASSASMIQRGDYSAGLDWAVSIDDSDARALALMSAARGYDLQDPVAASAWLESLSADPAMSRVVQGVSPYLTSSSSESRGAPGGFERRR